MLDAPNAVSRRPFRAALTGSRTFMGERLIAALEDDPRCEHILVLDIRKPRSARAKTRFARLDLTNPSADAQAATLLKADGIDVLCHLALLWEPSHSSSWAHELEAIGSFHVMNAAADAKVSKVVLSSTMMAYGAYPNNPNFLTEDHALRGNRASRWVMDKVAAERELAKLARDCPDIVCTTLRFGIITGPTVWGYFSRFLSRPVVPTVMGYDPLMQFLHEDDAARALLLAVRQDHPGPYNIVGDGLLYFSQAIRLGRRVALPCPHLMAFPASNLLWNLQLVDTPGPFLNYFRYPWVGESKRAEELLGFVPEHSSREALMAFFESHASQGSGPSREATR